MPRDGDLAARSWSFVGPESGTAADHDAAPVGDPWADQLLGAVGDDPDARALATALGTRAPASYRERTSPDQAALDVLELTELFEQVEQKKGDGPARASNGSHRFVVRPLPADRFHIRRFGTQPVELTSLLPMLESFGLVVEESVPHRLDLQEGPPTCIDDLGVHLQGTAGSSPSSPAAPAFDPATDGRRLVEALDAVVRGWTDVDHLNGLVASAGLDWRHAALLRAYTHYWAQCSPTIPPAECEEALLAFPGVAAALVGYFVARFDPEGAGDQAAARATCVAELGRVPQLRADRALRVYLQLIDATLRTNFFQTDEAGQPSEAITLKLESAAVPQLPAPRPRVETWVHAPRVEGVHLRAGLVARGGLRWSERPEDFRTEVLDLMVAQVKKNAIIVPTGAKGGFVCRAVTFPGPDDVRDAYTIFVRSMLAITDDYAGDRVVHPPAVAAPDGNDPYLVVAADKGTALLSDLANELSAERGFWLGDAFASGGSHGYNHKAMGITARGAWVSVRRHFHQLGIDVQREPIGVAGVGDMSGDVFGNGMLCSETIRLVAAFDHRHVFLDPDPDPATSYAERARLFRLPQSSWDDYTRTVLSPGGGVWSREAKEVPLDPAARRALGVDRDRMTPPELISAILEAPVDLLWFGGVGTFVKAAGESDASVGDRANDEVRVTADRVRARVVAEGGNLGLTQQARIRYSRRGGRINTDFIDNAAGVATSDREVNLKILLAMAIEEGRLDHAGRDERLQAAEDEVAAEVLRQVDHSVAALNRAVPDSADQLDAYAALIDMLEASERVDREVEDLPSTQELAVRRGAGAGMIRPELAVLLAYAKSDLSAAIEGASFLTDPSLAEAVSAYFPAPIRRELGDLIGKHRLYDQLLATALSGEIVDRLGIVWAHETAAELGRDLAGTAAAFWAAREVLGAASLWEELDRRWSEIPADADARLHDVIGDTVSALARTYLRHRDLARPSGVVAEDASVVAALSDAPVPEAALNELVAAGVDRATAERWLSAVQRARVAEVGPVVRATGKDVAEVTATFNLVDDAAGTDRMVRAIDRAATPNRWRSWLARATLDDLADWRVETVIDILRRGGEPADPMVGWATRHEVALAGARRLLLALEAQDADPVTIVAVALRRLPRPASVTDGL
jgi:glutamate dehydrogenase